jgi:hypothetical protein
MNPPTPVAFAWLTHEEFTRLSTDAKVMYLAEAIQVLTHERGSIFVGQPPQTPKPTLQ